MAWKTVFILFLAASGEAWGLPLLDGKTFPTAQAGGEILQVMPPDHFVVDERLRRNVDFWVRIYTQYGTQQGLIHDSKYIDLVYETIDLTSAPDAGALTGTAHHSKRVKDAKKKWKDVLLSLHAKGKQFEEFSADEQRVFLLFKDIDEPNKFLNAAHRKRIRFQQGHKEAFRDGLKQSGRYLSHMEGIFRDHGLPLELTRLPFVESSFNVRARSKVGASGIWQFMRSTGRQYLQINDALDERNDPIRATEAAARLLRLNYGALGRWPLAVTAYNYGRKGMMRAVRQVGSEQIEDVVGSYQGRTFGFASSNFFCGLLAAIEVEKNAEKYFGKIEREPLMKYYEVRMPHYMDLRDLVQFMRLEIKSLREMNPGLSELVFEGSRGIPAGYRLRLPYDGKSSQDLATRVFLAGYEEIPSIYKLQAQFRGKKSRVRNRAEEAKQ